MKPRHQMAAFGFFFFFYMLTTTREIPWNDAHPIYHTAGAIASRGELRIPVGGAPGQFTYALHPLMAAIAHVPGWIIYNRIIVDWMPFWSMAKVITSELGPAFFGALTCMLFLNAALNLGASRRLANAFALMLGLSTSVWVYARSPYSEIVQAATLMGLVGALLAFWRQPRRSTAFRVGFWAALLINSKVVFVLALPGAFLWCMYRLRHALRRFFVLAPWALLPVVAGAMVVLLHNRARTGDATATGYGNVSALAPALFNQPLWEGAWGLLASPGRCMFLFAPPLILSLFGIRSASQRHPHLLWLLMSCLLPVLVVYAKYDAWSGDWGWGPRYVVPMMPVLLLPAVVWLSEPTQTLLAARTKAVVAIGLALSGFLVQILGSAFYWDHFIRITANAKEIWLGIPNRTGAKYTPRLQGNCDPCFEDLYSLQWLPPFQQIAGHWWLLRTHVPTKIPLEQAAKTAPWTSYTTAFLPIEETYRRVRVDWWPLEFWKRFRPVTVALALFWSLGTIGCGTLWWLAARRRISTTAA